MGFQKQLFPTLETPENPFFKIFQQFFNNFSIHFLKFFQANSHNAENPKDFFGSLNAFSEPKT